MSSRDSGFIWLPWLCIMLMISSLLLVYLKTSKVLDDSDRCEQNLLNIYTALERYELDQGVFPRLSFYPADPLHGANSLRAVLASYGLVGSDCICPKATSEIVSAGLSYVWNVNLNNQAFGSREVEWLLMDIQAVHPQISGPHFKRVHILYSDGHIERTHVIPQGVEVHL